MDARRRGAPAATSLDRTCIDPHWLGLRDRHQSPKQRISGCPCARKASPDRCEPNSAPARTIWLLVLVLFPAKTVTLAQDRAGSFESNGVRIHYLDRGSGEPGVLIHGFAGSYEHDWEAPGVITAVGTAGYRVIAMDCRGHGRSDKPRNSSQYGLEMVNDVIRLLDHLRTPRVHAVGYSMGAGS